MSSIKLFKSAQALVKHESFGKASKSIGLTQSALSQNIKKLENHYGVKFFQRENGKTKPTVYGEMLLSLTDEIVDIEEKIVNQISLINNSDAGLLKIGLDPYLSGTILEPIISEMMEIYPDIKYRFFYLSTYSGVAQLRANKFDILISFDEREYRLNSNKNLDTLEVIPIKIKPPKFYAREDHEIFKDNEISIENIFDHNIYTTLPPAWFHNFYEKEVGEDVPYSHIVDKVSLVSADQNLHLRMVEKGDGIGIFYEFDLLNSKEQLKTIPIRNYPEKLNAMIAINKKWVKPQIAKIFLEMVSGRFS